MLSYGEIRVLILVNLQCCPAISQSLNKLSKYTHLLSNLSGNNISFAKLPCCSSIISCNYTSCNSQNTANSSSHTSPTLNEAQSLLKTLGWVYNTTFKFIMS